MIPEGIDQIAGERVHACLFSAHTCRRNLTNTTEKREKQLGLELRTHAQTKTLVSNGANILIDTAI